MVWQRAYESISDGNAAVRPDGGVPLHAERLVQIDRPDRICGVLPNQRRCLAVLDEQSKRYSGHRLDAGKLYHAADTHRRHEVVLRVVPESRRDATVPSPIGSAGSAPL